METNNKKKLFKEKDVNLIKAIAIQYIEIFKIVKQTCPRDFNHDEVTLIFIKTESIFNNIQLQIAKKIKKKARNGNGNGNKPLPKRVGRNREYYA